MIYEWDISNKDCPYIKRRIYEIGFTPKRIEVIQPEGIKILLVSQTGLCKFIELDCL